MAKASSRRIRDVPASTKVRILEAAEEVFATKGFEGASTRKIAAKAGVNISSLHYHWESKETLYHAVFQNIYNQLIEISRDSVLPTTARGDSPRGVHEASVGRVFDISRRTRTFRVCCCDGPSRTRSSATRPRAAFSYRRGRSWVAG